MGAWGIGSFENDDASDWLYDLESSRGQDLLIDTFKLAESEYLEAPDAACIVAAAEVYLLVVDKARVNFSDEVNAWLKSNLSCIDSRALKTPALCALEKVKSDQSELWELWVDAGLETDWVADIRMLIEFIESTD